MTCPKTGNCRHFGVISQMGVFLKLEKKYMEATFIYYI